MNRMKKNSLDVDECVLNPCKNGASCKDKVNGYKCQCKAGYSGTNCETGKLILYQLLPDYEVLFSKY